METWQLYIYNPSSGRSDSKDKPAQKDDELQVSSYFHGTSFHERQDTHSRVEMCDVAAPSSSQNRWSVTMAKRNRNITKNPATKGVTSIVYQCHTQEAHKNAYSSDVKGLDAASFDNTCLQYIETSQRYSVIK